MSTRTPNTRPRLHRLIVAHLPYPLAALDGQGRIVLCNDAFRRIFPEATDGALLGDALPDGSGGALLEGLAAGEEAQVVVELPAGSGGAPLALRLSACRTDQGASPGVTLVFAEDVTESVMRQKRLMANSRLVSVGEMAAGVAHELNNPLTAVVGFSELLLRQEMDDLMRRDLEAIAAEAHRAGRVVDTLLSFARAGQDEHRPFNAAETLHRVLELRTYECRVNNIEVVTYFDAATPSTMADVHGMEQVFLNLLNNSIQSIGSGTRRGVITIGVVAIGGRLRISFTDDGPGIPADVMPRIFNPFFTTKPAGKGTGLGLSICRGIVQKHGGTMRAESDPRRGTTFVVELPIVPVEARQEKAARRPSIQPASHTMLRVLAVDDEPIVTELLERALGLAGHEVDVARDGAEALRLMHLRDYDAIILDMKMPGLGGAEVYRCIQGMKPELVDRVLFSTGDMVNPETRLFIEKTGNQVMTKPFSLDELMRRMTGFAHDRDERMRRLAS